jgi:hypothetical protein
MLRATRWGTQFSPFEIDPALFAGRNFEIIQTGVSIDAILCDSLAAADRHAAEFDEAQPVEDELWIPAQDDEWEDVEELAVLEVSSDAPSPISSTESSPLSTPGPSCSPSPASEIRLPPTPVKPGQIHTQRKRERAAERCRSR